MSVSEAMQVCFRKEIKVYPIKDGRNWFVEYKEKNQKPHRYKKELIKKDEVNAALVATYKHLAKKIIAKT